MCGCVCERVWAFSPGLNRTMARRQPSSVLSICMSFILDTSSVRTLSETDVTPREQNDNDKKTTESTRSSRTRTACGVGRGGGVQDAHLSKMEPTPALWALLLWTWSPVANKIPSFTVTERWEKEAMSSSFQPGNRIK